MSTVFGVELLIMVRRIVKCSIIQVKNVWKYSWKPWADPGFIKRAANQVWAPIYYLANFSRKLHGMEKNGTRGGGGYVQNFTMQIRHWKRYFT